MDAYIGEIRLFAGTFAPKGWAFCNGQIIAINQNTALFSILGVMYGGDGKSTFALPNLQERVPMHFGVGPGLTNRPQGVPGGSDTLTLTATQMPSHSHAVLATADAVNQAGPVNAVFGTAAGGRGQQGPAMYAPANSSTVPLNPTSVTIAGGSLPISKIQPILAVNYIICLQGAFPPRE